jgi:hypothetical protein
MDSESQVKIKIVSIQPIQIKIKVISIQPINDRICIVTYIVPSLSDKLIKSTAYECPAFSKILEAIVIDSTHKHCLNIPGMATFERDDITKFDIDFSIWFPCRNNLMCSEIMNI